MPFTFAHAAAVLPLKRLTPRWLDWSALLLGSFAPDLLYLLPRGAREAATSTMPTTLLSDVIAGGLLFCVFHALIKQPALLLLPRAHRERLWPLTFRAWSWSPLLLLRIVGSLALATLLHRSWDAFTHAGDWGVSLVTPLQNTLWSIGSYRVTGCRVLQHGSGLLGLSLLAFFYWRWLRKPAAGPIFDGDDGDFLTLARDCPVLPRAWLVASWTILAIVPVLVASWRAVHLTMPFRGLTYFPYFAVAWMVSWILTLELTVLLYAMAVRSLLPKLFPGSRSDR